MTTGPVEYIIVAFPGNEFNGEIFPELQALVDTNTVRILDLVFIGKDDDGEVLSFEIEEVSAYAGLDSDVGGLISPSDIDHAARLLEPNMSAALLIWPASPWPKKRSRICAASLMRCWPSSSSWKKSMSRASSR